MRIISNRLPRALNLTSDLYTSLNEGDLQHKIGTFPSNSIGEQAWCIIGARESYFKAIKNSQWTGFSCSLEDHTSKQEIVSKLETTRNQIMKYLDLNKLAHIQLEYAFDLLEHEIQHHGQLIRYGYTNKLPFPKSWKSRYTV